MNTFANIARLAIAVFLCLVVWTVIAPTGKVDTKFVQDIIRSSANQVATLATIPTAAISTPKPTRRPVVAPVIDTTPVPGGQLPTPEGFGLTALPVYTECYEGSFYSCEDLDAMREQARLDPEDEMHDAVLATDEFIEATPIVQPEVQSKYYQLCVDTPKEHRHGLFKQICEGAGL